jgi:hypothetical protein
VGNPARYPHLSPEAPTLGPSSCSGTKAERKNVPRGEREVDKDDGLRVHWERSVVFHRSTITTTEAKKNMPGILTKDSCPKCDSDCIVTAVFLGLALESGSGLPIMVGDSGDLPNLEKALTKVNAALRTLNKGHKDLKAIVSPVWKPGSFITGGLKIHPKDGTMTEFVSEDGKNVKQYLGDGAYTGMVLMKGKDGDELKYWGSTFEVECGGARKLGQNLATEFKADLANMHRQKPGAKVTGYVHGMIQACYVAAKFTPAQAKVLELAAGTKTTKMASCIACTTFQLATNRQPSGIHLGSANSWVPLDPKNDWGIAHLMGPQCSEDIKGKDEKAQTKHKEELRADITRLNAMWVKRVGDWMVAGAKLSKDLIDPSDTSSNKRCKPHEGKWDRVKSWEKLQALAKNTGPALADTFLDGVGYFYKDQTRIIETLK